MEDFPDDIAVVTSTSELLAAASSRLAEVRLAPQQARSRSATVSLSPLHAMQGVIEEAKVPMTFEIAWEVCNKGKAVCHARCRLIVAKPSGSGLPTRSRANCGSCAPLALSHDSSVSRAKITHAACSGRYPHRHKDQGSANHL